MRCREWVLNRPSSGSGPAAMRMTVHHARLQGYIARSRSQLRSHALLQVCSSRMPLHAVIASQWVAHLAEMRCIAAKSLAHELLAV